VKKHEASRMAAEDATIQNVRLASSWFPLKKKGSPSEINEEIKFPR